MASMTRLLVVTVLFGALVAACGVQPSIAFSFENQTDLPVTVRVNDRLRLLIQPGETKAFNTPNNKGNRHVIATDERGTVRLDRTFTWAELEGMSFRLVIE
jgi:hypothetical protein